MLKAIDVQQVILQVEQAGKARHVQDQHAEMQQRYLDIQSGEEKKLLQKPVKNTEEAAGAREIISSKTTPGMPIEEIAERSGLTSGEVLLMLDLERARKGN